MIFDDIPCQRARPGRHQQWRRRSEGGFDASLYTVRPLSLSLAEEFVCNYHYAGTYVVDRYRFGLYAGRKLLGVAVFSIPSNIITLTSLFPDLRPYDESLELGRFVLDDTVAANGESWFLARCFAGLMDNGVRGVVSFSDPVPRHSSEGSLVFPGHIGVIYQASNAVYTGQAENKTQYLLPDGTELPGRALSKVRKGEQGGIQVIERLIAFGATPPRQREPMKMWLTRAVGQAQVHSRRRVGNHRYAFCLDHNVRLGRGSFPYPKNPLEKETTDAPAYGALRGH